MDQGGHFVTGFRDDTESNLCGLHFESGVGWGLFPKRPISSDNTEPDMHLDPHNGSLARLWLGCRNTWATTYKYRIHEWDGEDWTAHDFFGGGANYGGHTLVSRSPDDNRVVFVCCAAANGGKNMLAKFDNGTWSVLRAAGSYGTIFYIPLAISSTTCVWAAHTTYNDGGGEKAGYWLDPTTQYSGGDLPVRGFGGIARLANGQVFLLDVAGHVWRADSHLGPFVEDNPTCGPHIDGFAYLAGSGWPVAMSPSADGSTIVIQEQNGQKYWARNGYDDYTLCYTGQTNTGQPAAVDRQTLFAARAEGPPRASNDGGSTWYTVSNGFASVGNTLRARAACAFVGDVSTPQRLISVTQQAESGEAYRIHWRGDSPYSPWAPWGEFHVKPSGTDPQYMRSVVGFDSEHLVISGTRANAAYSNIVHYNPDSDSWTVFKLISDTCTALSCGSAYESGKLHALLYSRYSTPLIYGRWNGTSYDVANIPGSSRHSNDNFATYSFGYNVACDVTGQHIWITVYQSGQVWHSADGGTSWTNRYSAAAGVHADADQARDVFVVSATEVYVAFNSTGSGARFSKWNGSSWSAAAPDIAKPPGSYRCIYVDQAGALWFFESNPSSGPTATYKLVSGAWAIQNTYSSHGGVRDVTGITEMGDGSALAIAMDTEQATDGWDGHIQQLAQNDSLGWFTNRGISARTPFLGISPYGIAPYPPTMQNQVPAPGADGVSSATAIYVEVYDRNGNLDASTVNLYVDGTLAWRNDRALAGFSGARTAIVGGYSYTLTVSGGLPQGTHTVRGTASDTTDLSMDESYSFTTRADETPADDDADDDAAAGDRDIGIDLYLDSSHDLEVLNHDLRQVAGADEVAQHLLVGLKTFVGEWFIDEYAGVPYYLHVLVNSPKSRVIEGIFRRAILGDADIESITSFEMSVDRSTRKLSIQFTAVSSVGEVNVSAIFP